MRAFLGTLALLCCTPGFATVVNPINLSSAVTLDGAFTSPLEYQGDTPIGFLSPINGVGSAILASPPLANSFLYGHIAVGTVSIEPTLYVLFDYLGRTNPNFTNGEQVAKITFPTTLSATPVDVLLVGTGVGSGVNVLLDDHNSPPSANPFVNAAVGFHSSPNAAFSHMIIEFEVDLNTPGGFGIIPAMNGIYSTGPAAWYASAASDLVDPPISSAIFQLNPDGSTSITPFEFGVPEPATFGLMGCSLLVGLAFKRRC